MSAPVTVERLEALTAGELEQLFLTASAPDPDTLAGDYAGQVLASTFFPFNTRLGQRALRSARLPWRGKRIELAGQGPWVGANRVKLLGRRTTAVRFRVEGSSAGLDGRPCCSLSYNVEGAGWPLAKVRDEVRAIGPGTLLGRGFLSSGGRPRFLVYFALSRVSPGEAGESTDARG